MQSLTNLTFDFTFGNFEMIYDWTHQTGQVDKRWRRGQPPLIEPFSIPIGGLGMRTFVSECLSLQAPASWVFAGTLVQWIETNQVPSTTALGLPGLAIHEIRIPLNRQKLHVLEKTAQSFQFGFEPAPWLDQFSLKIWRWNGVEREEVLDELTDIQGELENVQDTLEEIKTQTDKIP